MIRLSAFADEISADLKVFFSPRPLPKKNEQTVLLPERGSAQAAKPSVHSFEGLSAAQRDFGEALPIWVKLFHFA